MSMLLRYRVVHELRNVSVGLCSALILACSGTDGEPTEIATDSELSIAPVCTTSPCVDITASGVNVNGRGQVVDCGGTGTGIRIANRSSVQLSNFEVRNCQVGILIEGGGSHRLHGLNVHNNALVVDDFGIGVGGEGMKLENTRDNRVANSSFNNNRFGITLFESHRNWFVNLKVNGNKGPSFRTPNVGIYLVNANQNVIVSNQLSDNKHFGVLVDGSSMQNAIARNSFSLTHAGVEFWAGSANHVYANTLARNSYGIRLQLGTSANRLERNVIRQSDTLDLADENPGCNGNVWRNNSFATDNEGDGPNAGCVR